MKSSQSFFNEFDYYITPSELIEFNYCKRFTYYMKCLNVPQFEENRFKVQKGKEIHSKKVIDKLAIMAASKVKVVRNGNIQEISINDLVLDDIVVFNTGNQIPTDCILIKGDILVNESFITGEPDSFSKGSGDMLLSGSYVVGGKCYAKVEHIGNDNYTAQISSGAKYVKKINSEIMNSLNKIIKILTFAIIPYFL